MNDIANSLVTITCSALAGGWLGIAGCALYRHLRRRRLNAEKLRIIAETDAHTKAFGEGLITFLDGSTAHLKPGDAVRWSSDDGDALAFHRNRCNGCSVCCRGDLCKGCKWCAGT